LVADAPDDFADAVALLLRDRAIGQRLGAAGHRLARDHYSWEGAAEKLAELYDRLIPVHAKRGGCK
jgi:glycosyltransferase involved in cell wall biosynthesis